MSATPGLYFAFGSNMTHARLRARVGTCEVVGTALLAGHALRFHKRGADGSGKCDAYRTQGKDDQVHGVVYRLTPAQLSRLDDFEGPGYVRRVLALVGMGRVVHAATYLARGEYIDPGLRPFSWYKELVLHGAVEHGLPLGYRVLIASVAPIDDGDAERAARNLRDIAFTG